MSYMKYKAFLKVNELNSFTKAGECLGYTQSAISQMISSLEGELNTTLLIRGKSGIKITNEGIELLPFIKEVCNSFDILSERAISINNIDNGVIKVGLIRSAAYTWFPELMAEFKEKYPNVKYEFTIGSSKEIQTMVRNEDIDFGITYSPVVSELVGVRLMEETLCLLGSENTSVNGAITLAEMEQTEFIWSKGDEEFDLLESLVCQKGIHLKKGLEAPDLLSSFAMAQMGLGMQVTNGSLAEKLNQGSKILALDFAASKEITVVLNDLNLISRTGKCFLDLLVEKYCR